MNIKEEVDVIWNMPKDNAFKARVEVILRNAVREGVLMLAATSNCGFNPNVLVKTYNAINEL